MISEVRPGVKQNLSETFRGSFGRRSTATDHWRSGPRWPAKVAPSSAAANTLITERMIRRGTFHTVHELEQAIYKWLASWNGEPIPFVWKATADVILDKVRRCKQLTATGD